METSRCIGKIKRHYLVFEIIVLGLQSDFFFITFSNLYLIVNTNKVNFFGPTKLIQMLAN